MRTKEKEIKELVGAVEVEYSIECHTCGNGEFALSADDASSAAMEFYNGGWRWQDDEVRCSECAQ